jgi:hypothetical protein
MKYAGEEAVDCSRRDKVMLYTLMGLGNVADMLA